MRQSLFAVLAFAPLASTGALAADRIEILDNGVQKVAACEGKDVEVVGDRAQLRLTGDCGKVEVSGNNNEVAFEGAEHLEVTGNVNQVSGTSVPRIDVGGTDNQVTWERQVKGKAPKIANLGKRNKIAQAPSASSLVPASASAAAGAATAGADADDDGEGSSSGASSGGGSVATALDRASAALGKANQALGAAGAATSSNGGGRISITDANLERTYACNGSDVAVDGANNTLTFTGECGTVLVNGSSNAIHLEAAAKIIANGTHNRVGWKRGAGKSAPVVSSNGIGNKVSREK